MGFSKATSVLRSSNHVRDVPPCDDPSCNDLPESWLNWFKRSTSTPPPDRAQIGRAGWLLIHSAAARYPLNPSSEAKVEVASWLRSFAHLYPCHVCRLGFVKVIDGVPPNTGSRDALSLWACEAHNMINEELGFPQYPCDLEKLLSRFGNLADA